MEVHNGLDTSAAPHCEGNNNGTCEHDAQDDMMASKYNLWLYGKKFIVLRADTTPCDETSHA